MHLKRILCYSLSLALMAGVFITSSSTEVSAATMTAETEVAENVQPRIKWTGEVKLYVNTWSNIIGENNIFSDRPLVLSDANNPGDIIVRVLDANGDQVGDVKTVRKGKSITLDNIPWNSGNYIIQGKALTTKGIYKLTVD